MQFIGTTNRGQECAIQRNEGDPSQYLMLVTSSALLRHFPALPCDVVTHLIQ